MSEEKKVTIAAFTTKEDRESGDLKKAINILATVDNPTDLLHKTRAKQGECLGFFDQYGKRFASFEKAIEYLGGSFQTYKKSHHVVYFDEKGKPIKPPGT